MSVLCSDSQGKTLSGKTAAKDASGSGRRKWLTKCGSSTPSHRQKLSTNSRGLQESPGPPSPKPQKKSLKKRPFGWSAKKSPKKCTKNHKKKTPKSELLWGYFCLIFADPPKSLFLRLFFCGFGPGGPGDPCRWSLGSQPEDPKMEQFQDFRLGLTFSSVNDHGKKPITSFEPKKWLEVNFPLRGKSYIFPQPIKTPFSQTLHFMGRLAI